MYWTPLVGCPWNSWVILFHLNISAKVGISLWTRHSCPHIFPSQVLCCFTPVPASYFTCPSQTSPVCPLKTLFYTKLPFTCHNQLRFLLFPSLNWNLIHPQRFHFFLFFSFFLKKGWLFFRLLSHWNLQINLATSTIQQCSFQPVFPQVHSYTFLWISLWKSKFLLKWLLLLHRRAPRKNELY